MNKEERIQAHAALIETLNQDLIALVGLAQRSSGRQYDDLQETINKQKSMIAREGILLAADVLRGN